MAPTAGLDLSKSECEEIVNAKATSRNDIELLGTELGIEGRNGEGSDAKTVLFQKLVCCFYWITSHDVVFCNYSTHFLNWKHKTKCER